jgi:hypothetical protein
MTIRGNIGDSFALFRLSRALNVPSALVIAAVIYFAAWHFSVKALSLEVRE